MTGPRIGSMCTGYGGLDAAAQAVLGGDIAWVADPDPNASKILAHHHPDVPNHGDIKATDWAQVEPVDIVTAGYPCQPFSDAGRQLGVEDERHIWPYIATALRVLRPRIVVLENVRGHLGRGFDIVLADLASLGFDAEWRTVRASEVGAPHRRERLFVVATAADAADVGYERSRPARGWRPGPADGRLAAADAQGARREGPRSESARCGSERGGRSAADADRNGCSRRQERDRGTAARGEVQHRNDADGCVLEWGTYGPAIRRWERILGRPAPAPTEPGANGQPRLTPPFVEWLMGLPAGHVTDVPGISRNAQLRLLGNGVVPQQGAAAITHLIERRAAA